MGTSGSSSSSGYWGTTTSSAEQTGYWASHYADGGRRFLPNNHVGDSSSKTYVPRSGKEKQRPVDPYASGGGSESLYPRDWNATRVLPNALGYSSASDGGSQATTSSYPREWNATRITLAGGRRRSSPMEPDSFNLGSTMMRTSTSSTYEGVYCCGAFCCQSGPCCGDEEEYEDSVWGSQADMTLMSTASSGPTRNNFETVHHPAKENWGEIAWHYGRH